MNREYMGARTGVLPKVELNAGGKVEKAVFQSHEGLGILPSQAQE